MPRHWRSRRGRERVALVPQCKCASGFRWSPCMRDCGYTSSMDASLQTRLLAINRDFYARFAQEFSDTRRVEHVNLSAIMPYLRDGVKLLDIGCGSGRVAERLEREQLSIDYTGVDVTAAFVAA